METVPLLFLVFLSLLTEGLAIQCYICSWSPEDQNNSTDSCTDFGFQSHKSYIHTCDHGCEIFVQWDSNGRMEQWRRNCFQKNHLPLTGDCKWDVSIGWKRKICTCDVDFCNSAFSFKEITIMTSLCSVIFAMFAGNRLF